MEVKKPTAEQMAKFKKNAKDPSLSAEVRAKFQAIVDKFSEDVKDVEDKIEGKTEPKKRAGRKPSTTKKYKTLPKPKMVALITATKDAVEDMKAQLKKLGYNPEEVDALNGNQAFAILEELKSKMVGKPKRTATPRATKKTAIDIEKAKAEIKAKTGKTEEECEAIIEQYRELRTKAQQGKIKAEQANADNKKRVEKLEQKGDLIEGTNIKTADAVIESTAKDVAEKIEQQIEAVEEKAEKEAKAEVAKDNTIKTPKDKKEAVKEKVDEKIKKETKIVVERVVIDTSALLTSIATSLGKFDKDSQKEFLIKLRSDIDKLLAKYAFGGMTDGAVQVMNVQQSNLSSSSVNPTMFANGGGIMADGRIVLRTFNGVGGNKNKTYKLIKDDRDSDGKPYYTLIEDQSGNVMAQGDSFDEVNGYANLMSGKFANGGGVEYVSWEITFFDRYDTKSFVLDVQGDFDNEQDAIDEVVREYDIYVDEDNYGQMYYNGNPVEVSDAKRVIEHRRFKKGGNVSDLDYSDILEDLKVLLTDSVYELSNEFENKFNADGEEVEHQSRDGFIAFTDGGYEVRWFEYLRHYFTSGYSLPTKALEKEKDRQIDLSLEDAKDYFKNEYPEIVEELGEENIDYNSLYEAGYESEALDLDEVEMDMMDGTIMCEIGAYYYTPNNDRGIDGKHTLRLFGLVNLESPYHRSGNLEDRYDIDITFDSIYELNEKVDEGLKEIIDWFNGSHYFKSTEELRIRRMAKGGLTEHGLKVGDKIEKKLDAQGEVIRVKNKKENAFVHLDNGYRMRIGEFSTMKKGGKLWIDTKGKGGLKGVKPSRKNSFRNEAVKRGLTSGQLASRVLANPSRYKGINPKSAQLVKNMGVRKHGGSIGDVLRNRRGE